METKELKPRKTRHYGWKPDLPSIHDKQFSSLPKTKAIPPPAYDLRKQYPLPPCYDQGQLGSCTGNGCGFVWQFALLREKLPAPMPSRLFVYYGERVIEGDVSQDNGAQIRDGMTVLAKQGCCDEKFWPYITQKFAIKPPQNVYTEAAKHTGTQYLSVAQNLNEFKTCLSSGFPIVFGFTVYESFESDAVARTGVVPIPGRNDQDIGGHCVVMVGYDDVKKVFICRNSWGTGWGQNGYFTIPYNYLLNVNLANDFWTLRLVKG